MLSVNPLIAGLWGGWGELGEYQGSPRGLRVTSPSGTGIF